MKVIAEIFKWLVLLCWTITLFFLIREFNTAATNIRAGLPIRDEIDDIRWIVALILFFFTLIGYIALRVKSKSNFIVGATIISAAAFSILVFAQE